MRSIISLCVCLLLIRTACALTVIDDEQNTIRLEKPASRVITLAPSLTEMIYEINAQDALIATVEHSNFPQAARQKPRIGNHERFVMERVIGMRPDLVIAWASANSAQQLARLEQMHIPVYRSEPRKLSDISRTIRHLGILTGHEAGAESIADRFDQRLKNLRQSNRNKLRLKAFYQVWYQPVYTVNGEHIISRIMDLCGLDNAFAGSQVLAPKVTVESVIGHNPDLIIASGMASAQPEWLEMWRKWPSMKAVRFNNLFFIDPDLLQRQSVRVLDAAEIMCRQADQARSRLGNARQK